MKRYSDIWADVGVLYYLLMYVFYFYLSGKVAKQKSHHGYQQGMHVNEMMQ